MRAAVLGRPVGHSLSPVLHTAAYAALGLADWSYAAVDCGEDELPAWVARLGPEWAGLSLTMPLKRAALGVADAVDPLAAAVGAANTLVLPGAPRPAPGPTDHPTGAPADPPRDGTGGETADERGDEIAGERPGGTAGEQRGGTAGERRDEIAGGRPGGTARERPGGTARERPGGMAGGRRAYNTDVLGIAAALREVGLDSPRSAVVLGAGGTAQAALGALRTLGLTGAVVLVRDPARAGELLAAADRLGVAVDLRTGLPGPVPPADLVISTLPAGAVDRLRPPAGAVVLDVVYAPWPTPFAAAASAAGGTVVSGLAMLLHQAAGQVELMTGRPAPLAAMRTALDAAVRAGSEKPPAPAGA